MKPVALSFYERTRYAHKIIVVDLGFLGDSVHLVPALWEIKEHYPEAQLHTLSATVGAELLKLAPCVDKAWAFPLTPQSPRWWKHRDILMALRREKFDVAYNFSGADRTIFTTALTGAKWRLAHEGGRKHFWNSWLISTWVTRRSPELPVYEQRRQVLAKAGFSLSQLRFDLNVPQKAKESVAASIPMNSVHFSINASTPLKEWPLDHWVELAKLFLASDPSVQIIATASNQKRETDRLDHLANAVPDARLLCLPGLEIGHLAALLQRCRLHIGTDSGVLHLAVALGISTFSIFRKYPGLKEWLPPATLQHKYLATGCSCIDNVQADCLKTGGAACLASISPAEVYEATRPLRPIAAQHLKL